MKKIILFLFVLFLGASTLEAVPAWPGRLVFTQPDGTAITLYRHGDEWGNWLTDTRGRVVLRDDDGFFRVHEEISPVSAASAARFRRRAVQQRSVRPASHPAALGSRHFLVILVEFQDLGFTVEDPQAAFSRLLNEPGYSVNGATGSARDYYYENSHGRFEPVFDVYGPVKVSGTKAYYGGGNPDERPQVALTEGCRLLDGEIDFSRYDEDGDGMVDMVFMYYAGYGEADSPDVNSIWPHSGYVHDHDEGLRLDGVSIDLYACANEIIGTGENMGKMVGIAQACHEFGHALGLPDFYDVNALTDGFAAGVLGFSLMDRGVYNNEGRTPPYLTMMERSILGWVPERSIALFEKSGTVSLPSVDQEVAYMTPTDEPGEYYLYECRTQTGWDRYLGAYGLVIYHVDRSQREMTVKGAPTPITEIWTTEINLVNANGSHPCFYVVPSSDPSSLRYGFKYANYFYDYLPDMMPGVPFPGVAGVTSFTPVSWSGVTGEIPLSDISFDGSQARFHVTVPENTMDYVTIQNPGNSVYKAGERFHLALSDKTRDSVTKVEWSFDSMKTDESDVVLSAGKHTVDATVTNGSGKTYTVTLLLEAR